MAANAQNQERSPMVIVGVDGSSTGERALDWAAAAAARRGNTLRIVHALSMPLVTTPYAVPTRFSPTPEVADQANALLSDAVDRVGRLHPGVKTETVMSEDDASWALLEAARQGDLVVVGSRGLGAVRSVVLGSVSVRVSSHAPCPVIVVPPAEEAEKAEKAEKTEEATTDQRRIVVGVDGSKPSLRALRFALSEAADADAELVIVNSWQVPIPLDGMSLAASGYRLDEDPFVRGSEELVSAQLQEAVTEKTEGVDTRGVSTQEHPVTALLDAGKGADLIVVGSRGRGGFRGLMLGSVSQGVLHHATVPVAVLPPHAEDAEDKNGEE